MAAVNKPVQPDSVSEKVRAEPSPAVTPVDQGGLQNPPTQPRAKAYSYIRMSTREQLQGDSLDRQYDRTKQFVNDKNLELVENYEAIGVSAFRGNHQQGALGQFLEALRDNVVEPGSYLIVESMDRLSRQAPMEAMSMFNEIISRGVVVATLDDGTEYSAEGFAQNQYKLFMALGSMMRAHAESARKSDLLASAWGAKRSRLIKDGTILTATVPAWLRADKSKNAIEPIPERVAIIKEIFDLTCNGYGIYSIASLLNERREKAWGTTRQTKVRAKNKAKPIWRDSYIKKILVNRAVLGEFQPHKTEISLNKKKIRIPVGEVLEGYYPQVISPEVFRDAQLAMKRRQNGARGRKGPTYANLFTGLVHCAVCGAGMRYLDKGGKTKDSKYLKCSVAVSRGGCDPKSFRYEPVEQVILSSLETLDVQKILSGEAISKKLREKKALREKARIELEATSKKIANIRRLIVDDDGPLPRSTLSDMRTLERDEDRIRSEISLLDAEIDDLLLIDPEKRQTILNDLMVAIQDEDGEKKVRSRRALAAELQRMVKTILLTRDIEASLMRDPTEPSWSELLPDVAADRLEKYLSDFGFEASIRYQNGEQVIVRGLNMRRLKLKSGPQFARMKSLARFESNQ